jgi:hypothetical protein
MAVSSESEPTSAVKGMHMSSNSELNQLEISGNCRFAHIYLSHFLARKISHAGVSATIPVVVFPYRHVLIGSQWPQQKQSHHLC